MLPSQKGLYIFTLASGIAADQLTKFIAQKILSGNAGYSFLGNSFCFIYAMNKGSFMSVGDGLPAPARLVVFTIMIGLGLAGLAVVLWFRPGMRSDRLVGYALILAGGLGNWIDRAAFGAVRDFMNVGWGQLRSGIFNVADLLIEAGVILLLLSYRRGQ